MYLILIKIINKPHLRLGHLEKKRKEVNYFQLCYLWIKISIKKLNEMVLLIPDQSQKFYIHLKF